MESTRAGKATLVLSGCGEHNTPGALARGELVIPVTLAVTNETAAGSISHDAFLVTLPEIVIENGRGKGPGRS